MKKTASTKSAAAKVTARKNTRKEVKQNQYHDEYHKEPFSFVKPPQNNKNDKRSLKFPVFDNFLKSDMIDDVKNGMNSCVNVTDCTISNVVDTAGVASNMVEAVLGKVSKSLSDSTQQNMRLGQELLRCRDARDMISFNQKMFETNFHNMVNLYLDVSSAVQCFITKHVGLSSGYLDKNIKCFTSK